MTNQPEVERALEQKDRYAGLFEDVPVSLWVVDFSAAQVYLGRLRDSGVEDFRTFLEEHPDIVVQCAGMVQVVNVNRATLELYKAEDKAALLGNFSRNFLVVSYDAFKEQLVAVTEGRIRTENETLSQTLDGEERCVLIKWTVASGCEETYEQVWISIIDITRLKQAEDNLLQHAADMQVRIEELDAFAHTVAHELKNPLALVVGYAESMEEHYSALSEEQARDFLETIARSGRKMTSIIQELLLLATVRKAEIPTMPLDMTGIVEHALQRVLDMIEEYKARVVVAGDWPMVVGYPYWVEEVWANYLSNALKYGGRPPEVELGWSLSPDGMVRFWVQDNGPGLWPEDQARLFKPFSRVGHSRAEGHGLGLSIVQHIVEKLGGQVGVESEVGRGSTFYFTLPVAEAGSTPSVS